MMTIPPPLLKTLPFLAYGITAMTLLVIVCLAIAVFNDAHARHRTHNGTFLVGPIFWATIVLMTGGFTGAFAYWLIHYSALRYVPRGQGT